ncbi:BTB/POZ and MATH domain-containing protein 2-like [Triticum dicoccoides]|uniref:BTB/POZ and MATH domain-containing protein 2-like n=1 Tax=Triticum dicoccoides TaxID=85692 RepID=UPI0018911004|nr:BTB/POZ and MATH domain-containing protein 2-like [Triticum dicoccoides]
MSSFAGVSVVANDELCPDTQSTVRTSADCGYHLLVVQDYSRAKKSISSRPFMVGGHCWLLFYCPHGENHTCADVVSVRLSCIQDDSEKQPVEAKVVFSLIGQVELQNPVYIAQSEACSFDPCSQSIEQDFRRDALERSSVKLKDDYLTVRCDVMVCNTNPRDDDDDAAATITKARLPNICRDFNILFKTEAGADVTFEVGGNKLATHRCVLAARSKVFMAQLFGPMKEATAQTGVIHIKDMEASVFRALLSFIYTDSLPSMEEDNMEEDNRQEVEASEDEMSRVVEQGQEDEEVIENEIWLQWLQNLLVAADRYDVQRLKCICEEQLSEHISVRMVMSTLALAEQHHCQGLKEACFKFIQVQPPSCLQAVMATDG